MIAAAVLIPEPSVSVALYISDILAASVSQVFTIFSNCLSPIAVSHSAIVVFTCITNVLAILAIGVASSILGTGRVSRDQNEPKCKGRRKYSKP